MKLTQKSLTRGEHQSTVLGNSRKDSIRTIIFPSEGQRKHRKHHLQGLCCHTWLIHNMTVELDERYAERSQLKKIIMYILICHLIYQVTANVT